MSWTGYRLAKAQSRAQIPTYDPQKNTFYLGDVTAQFMFSGTRKPADVAVPPDGEKGGERRGLT
jgi:hypothetical protein